MLNFDVRASAFWRGSPCTALGPNLTASMKTSSGLGTPVQAISFPISLRSEDKHWSFGSDSMR